MGVGNIDWENLINVLKKYYDGTITLEIFSRDRDYVLLSKEKLKKLWKK
jgi:sugar phosphate isomerase/epimerase